MDELERLTPGGQALEELLHLPEFLLQEPYQAFRGKTEEKKSPRASGSGNGKVAIFEIRPQCSVLLSRPAFRGNCFTRV